MPNIDENLAFAPSYELAALIADKQVSPVEVTQLYYDRIDQLGLAAQLVPDADTGYGNGISAGSRGSRNAR